MTAEAPREDPRALIVLLSVIFLNMAGFGLVIPLLPFFGQAFDAPAWQITLMFSAFSVGQFLGEPFWGKLSDRIGRRPVLILTTAGGALAYVALALAPGIWTALAVRLVSGFLSGNISTLQGYLADITPPQQRAGRMGIMGSAFSLGFMVGPALGGLLARPELGPTGFQIPLYVAAAFGLASALGVVLFMRETIVPQTKGMVRPPAPPRGVVLREALADPVILRVFLISFVTISGFAGIEATYGLWTEARFGWGPREIGLAFMLAGIIGVVAQGSLTGLLVRRYGEGRVLLAGLCLMFVGMVTQFTAIGWPMAVVGLAIVVFGQSITFPNLVALISMATPSERQGEVLGLNMSNSALARIGGPILAGQLFSLVAPGAPFALTAILILPAIWLCLQIMARVTDRRA
ncbi:MAG: MFS transporter [Phenylobacterium sp.]|uniref:MFS transporter n=1 Tax=Phenylobacterium sp. TaxID=1871053 RepID=UPI002732AA92|nr:MFS transporter [Phenylobacterium sp.]MDP1643658.1 MFS transporter [Phenylobacterium sp.]MDP3115520.1 MFS transporter [Phenylobacterium sp.]